MELFATGTKRPDLDRGIVFLFDMVYGWGMTKDITPEQQKIISNAWHKFFIETTTFDSDHDKPNGWCWFWCLYDTYNNSYELPNLDLATIQSKLHNQHWLKITNDKIQEACDIINGDNTTGDSKFLGSGLVLLHNLGKANLPKFPKIDFSGLPFDDKMDFLDFIFPVDTDFSNTTFSKDVYFTNAVFFDTASFKNAEFHGETANFRNATFEKEADFEKATFKNYANFKGATFSDRTIFQLAKFELHAPRFYGAKFNNELILNRIKLPDAKKDKKNENDNDDELYEKRVEENKSAYETLIHLMEKQNKHHERHRFFREEMRWRQLGNKITEKRLINAAWQGDEEYYSFGKLFGNSFTIIFFWLYDTTSEYGHGIGRAFGWWLLHIILGAIAIFIIASCAGLGTEQALFCAASTSSANANPFVFIGFKEGGLMDCYKVLHYLLPIEFGTIRGIQTFIGIPLLFILLTTLRVRFRIK